MQWFVKVMQNYAVFDGRARRTEYWMYTLFCIIFSIVANIIDAIIGYPIFSFLFGLAVLIPSLAVGVRRLHDTDKSGWWMLIALVPFIGAIVLLVFFCMEGTRGPNRFGPDPKA